MLHNFDFMVTPLPWLGVDFERLFIGGGVLGAFLGFFASCPNPSPTCLRMGPKERRASSEVPLVSTSPGNTSSFLTCSTFFSFLPPFLFLGRQHKSPGKEEKGRQIQKENGSNPRWGRQVATSKFILRALAQRRGIFMSISVQIIIRQLWASTIINAGLLFL